MSAESGLKTFRDHDGLWEGHDVQEVATPGAWDANPALVLKFYNERRQNLCDSKPNQGHIALAELESDFDIEIITQNVDDLHEKAGSQQVLHLHGELSQSRSTADSSLVYDIKGPRLDLGDFCELGSQLRPNIVWFGESVPAMESAVSITKKAEIFVVIGTSLAVYPAASLLDYVRPGIPIYLIDPKRPDCYLPEYIEHIEEGASQGMKSLRAALLEEAI